MKTSLVQLVLKNYLQLQIPSFRVPDPALFSVHYEHFSFLKLPFEFYEVVILPFLDWQHLEQKITIIVECCLEKKLILSLFFSIFRFRQSLPIEYILKELAFDKLEDWKKFTQTFQLSYTDSSQSSLDCKTSMAGLSSIS